MENVVYSPSTRIRMPHLHIKQHDNCRLTSRERHEDLLGWLKSAESVEACHFSKQQLASPHVVTSRAMIA